MGDSAVIRHALDFALRLVDTTNGLPTGTVGVVVTREGKKLEPILRDDGTLIFLTAASREDSVITVSLPNYETREARLCFAELDPQVPLLELHMIPSAAFAGALRCHTLSGQKPGLLAVDAVRAGESPCLAREFDQRKKILTVLNPHKLALDAIYYGIVDPDSGTYEAIEIKERLSEQELKLTARLEKEIKNYFPVCRRIFGLTDAQGGYLLRVRADRSVAAWHVRYVFDGREEFETVELR